MPNNVRAKADFKEIRAAFREQLKDVATKKRSKMVGHNFVCFEVFQKEIVQKYLLPLCDVFSSGADNIVVDAESEDSEMKGGFATSAATSAEVEL